MGTPSHGQQDSASTFDNAERALSFMERLGKLIRENKALAVTIISGFLGGTGGLIHQQQKIEKLQNQTINVNVENAGDFAPEASRINDEVVKLRSKVDSLDKANKKHMEDYH